MCCRWAGLFVATKAHERSHTGGTARACNAGGGEKDDQNSTGAPWQSTSLPGPSYDGMFSKRLLAASLEPLMLSLLADGPKYGYEIIQCARRLSNDQIHWPNSKLYPLLHRLECDGLVEAFWQPSDSGPDRKYYRLTPKGQKALAATKKEWQSMNAIFAQLWEPELSMG